MIDTSLFPYDTFPIRLEFGEKKNVTVCHFQCQDHLDKYLQRHKLDNRTIKIDYRDGEPPKPSEKRKRSVEQKSQPKNNGSASPVRKRKPSVDSSRNPTSNSKRKK